MKNNQIPVTFPGIDIVEASAGSGKTYALAKRFIQLIMHPSIDEIEDPLKSILAITFTNKATVEMKERILEFLKRIALDSFDNKTVEKDIFSSLEIDKKDARSRAMFVLDKIMENYDAFQVQTIDSFINMLISGSSFRLGLSSTSKVQDNYRQYLEYSLDGVIEKAGSDKKIFNVFEKFLDYYLFVENRDGWFSKRDILKLIDTLFNYSMSYAGKFVLPTVKGSNIRNKKKKVIDTVKWIYNTAPDGTDKRFISGMENLIDAENGTFSLDGLSAYFRRDLFPVKKNVVVPKELERKWDTLRGLLKKLAEEEAYAMFIPYINIFNLVIDEFRSISGEEDIVFLQELNDLASSLMDEEFLDVSELYYRITARVRNFLIDEFQDTSTLQWGNLKPLVDEAVASGGTLFYVGDKKQAIFRFRGGNVSLFDEVNDYYAGLSPRKSFLARNYRSAKNIIDLNNKVFSQVNLKYFVGMVEDGLEKGLIMSDNNKNKVFSVFTDVAQVPRKGASGGYVRVEKIKAEDDEDQEEIIKEKLLGRIKDISSRMPLGEITVLARSNAEIKLLTAWLMASGIPVESERTLDVKDHYIIKEIMSLLSFLASPIDDIAFAGFILGDVFTKATGLDKSVLRDFLFKMRASAKNGRILYNDFRKEFKNVWEEFIEEFFRGVGFVPIYELLISIYRKYSLMENFPGCQGFFLKFLEIVKDKEEETSGIHNFIEIFTELDDRDRYVSIPGKEAVNIITIHKSKGLEFSSVIIPFLSMEINVGSGRGMWKKPYVIKPMDNGTIDIMQLRKKCVLFSEKMSGEYMDEYTNSMIDELDNIYVAFTRAKQELHVFVPEKSGRSRNIAVNLFAEDLIEKGTASKSKGPGARGMGQEVKVLPPSKYSDWISLLKEETVNISELLNKKEILKGDICHFMLSLLVSLKKEDIKAYISECLERAWYRFPYAGDELLARCAGVVEGLVSAEGLGYIFEPSEYSVYNEKEIVEGNGLTKRIDRMLLSNKKVIIVDYKSSEEGMPEHKEQVKGYKKILEEIYSGHEVEGLLLYMDTRRAVEV